MFTEAFLFAVIRKIIGKVHLGNILHQIAGVGQIQDIGVFLSMLLCIGFCKFALTNTGNAMKKYLSMFQQQSMKHFQFFFTSAEISARLWCSFISNEITENRRKLSVGEEILYLWVTFDKFTFHAEAENICNK